MISYKKFGNLRLHQFISNSELTELNNWEFEDHLWVGEALGFSEWLRLEKEPNILRSLAVDFSEFPFDAAKRVLDLIDLPLDKGLKYSEIEAILGEPFKSYSFIEDRKSYDFTTNGKEPFIVSCTVLNDGGLTYIAIRRPLSEGNINKA